LSSKPPMTDETEPRAAMVTLTETVGAGGAFALVAMVLVVVADVVLRAFAGGGLIGTTELVSDWFMVAIMFLALGGLQAKKLHISVDLARGHLPARLDAALDLLACALMIAAAAGLAWYTGGQAYEATLAGERIEMPGLNLPIWPPRWLVPLGFALAGIVAILQAIEAARIIARGAR
jgi:TRAP-type C4-dicarboxylate transport system permease small subunit